MESDGRKPSSAYEQLWCSLTISDDSRERGLEEPHAGEIGLHVGFQRVPLPHYGQVENYQRPHQKEHDHTRRRSQPKEKKKVSANAIAQMLLPPRVSHIKWKMELPSSSYIMHYDLRQSRSLICACFVIGCLDPSRSEQVRRVALVWCRLGVV